MPEGPLGAPRPYASSNLAVVFELHADEDVLPTKGEERELNKTSNREKAGRILSAALESVGIVVDPSKIGIEDELREDVSIPQSRNFIVIGTESNLITTVDIESIVEEANRRFRDNGLSVRTYVQSVGVAAI